MTQEPGKKSKEIATCRPISLLSTSYKVLERIVLNRNPENCLPDHQYGFKQAHSTTQQCYRIGNLFNNAIEKKH